VLSLSQHCIHSINHSPTSPQHSSNVISVGHNTLNSTFIIFYFLQLFPPTQPTTRWSFSSFSVFLNSISNLYEIRLKSLIRQYLVLIKTSFMALMDFLIVHLQKLILYISCILNKKLFIKSLSISKLIVARCLHMICFISELCQNNVSCQLRVKSSG